METFNNVRKELKTNENTKIISKRLQTVAFILSSLCSMYNYLLKRLIFVRLIDFHLQRIQKEQTIFS